MPPRKLHSVMFPLWLIVRISAVPPLYRLKMALALVSPRRFVPEYRMRVARAELAPLGSGDLSGVQVLVVVGRSDRGITLNLKAPLLIHPGRRLGCQVVTNGELPVRFELNAGPLAWKKTA